MTEARFKEIMLKVGLTQFEVDRLWDAKPDDMAAEDLLVKCYFLHS